MIRHLSDNFNSDREDGREKADPAEITRAINVLFGTEDVVELRVLQTTIDGRHAGTVSGYFDGMNRSSLVQAIEYCSGRAAGVYVTLNPVRPDLVARADNRAIQYAKSTTKDDEIVRRVWMLIDFDPKRPPGVS